MKFSTISCCIIHIYILISNSEILQRKKILDIGNSVLRDYNSELETLTVEFRFKQ